MNTTRYTITEGQIVRLQHDRPEDAIDYAVAGPLKTLEFLGFRLEGTGGNCEARTLDLADGASVWVSDDSSDPNDEWNTIDCAECDRNGEEIDTGTYWCNFDVSQMAADEIDAFAMDMVEYANRAVAATAGA